MLPTLSRLSVRSGPEGRLRHWCSSRYLRIPPLHQEFRAPLPASRNAVRHAVPRLSRGISHSAYASAYTRFKPSDTEQRLPPSSYRGCWHEVSRDFLWTRSIRRSGLSKSRQRFTPRRASSRTRRRWVRLSPIAQDSLLQPSVEVRAVSQSRCGGPTSQSRYPSSPW